MAGRFFPPAERLFCLPDQEHVPVVIQMSQHRGSARIPVGAALPSRSEHSTLPSRSERATLPSRSEMDRASRASAAGLGCIRGTTFAFLFEAGAALLVYGICQLWQLFQ